MGIFCGRTDTDGTGTLDRNFLRSVNLTEGRKGKTDKPNLLGKHAQDGFYITQE